MKKLIALILTSVILFSFCSCKNEEIVRIHIVANDDSVLSQENKLLVRDRVLEFLSPLLSSCSSNEDACRTIEENLENISLIANEYSLFPACVTLGKEHFCEKVYEGKTYPEGDYTALMIRLGKAEGHNWWGVAYPCAFGASPKNEKPKYKSIIVTLFERLGIF